MFLRRLGTPLTASTHLCSGGHGCPDILELTTGDFAVIGTDITQAAANLLPVGSGCGPLERVVQIPRQTLINARNDIPAAMG